MKTTSSVSRFIDQWTPSISKRTGSYWLTRFVFLRLLGLTYLIAFLVIVWQWRPLLGEDGLLPVSLYLERMATNYGSPWDAFLQRPSLFWLNHSDHVMQWMAYIGTALSLLLLSGYANALLLFLLWALYLSFAHVGQLFYGYGWEMILLETGFLAIFLCPLWNGRPFKNNTAPSVVVIWLLRWVLFRVMFGAGLIKLRGDPCWLDLSCLDYHFETQPIPNPLSPYFHQLPAFMLKAGVFFNHMTELIAPWLIFGPRYVRYLGGGLMILFQGVLILSGNLSWLNWLTLVLCVVCFDDRALRWLFPKRLLATIKDYAAGITRSALQTAVILVLTLVIGYLSIDPVLNLFSSHQAMNRSYDPLRLVNTYGAFGSVGRKRPEVILEGTYDETIDENTQWIEYQFKCKPGDVNRRPCFMSPYHYRIDWQIWFAAMSNYQRNPWLVHFVAKLLEENPGALSLLADNPFKEGPPKYIRAELYEYQLTDPFADTSAWWQRRHVKPYLPPLSRDDPQLSKFLKEHGWMQ